MSTTTKRRRRNKTVENEETFTAEPQPRRRRRWWLLSIFAFLVTVVWLLPGIIANTPLLPWILAKATADLNGTLQVKSASLGWFSPIAVEEIEVRDAAQQPILQAALLKGDTSLAAILWDSSKLGTLRLENPKLNVVLRSDGSNVEDLIAKYLEPSEGPSAELHTVLEIVDGSVTITDQTNRRSWQMDKLQLKLDISTGASTSMKLETTAAVPDAKRPGKLTASFSAQLPRADEQMSLGQGKLNLDTTAIPLAMADGMLARFAPGTKLGGWLTSKVHAKWGEQIVVSADVTTDNVMLATPALGTDRLELQQLQGACRVSQQKELLEVEQASIDCDLGSLSAAGTLKLGRNWTEQLAASLLKQKCTIDGRIDLARLARMLPATLHIREGTEITSGQVKLALSSRPNPQSKDPEAMIWQGRIETGDLKAVHQGREFAWPRPILVTLAAYQSARGPVVENLKCESDFLKLHLAGTLDELTASGTFDLKKLADQLGQFVDFGSVSLAGNGWTHLNWKISEQQQFESDLELQIRNLQLGLSEGQSWVEENLIVMASAGGRTDFGAGTQLQTASVQVRTQAEQITAQLTRPVLDFNRGGTWPVKLQMTGQLQSWPARLNNFMELKDFEVAGDYSLQADVAASADTAVISQGTLTVAQLRLKTPQVDVAEPSLRLVLSAGWDQQRRRLTVKSADLAAGELALRAENAVLALPEEGAPEMSGLVRYRADLAKLQGWLAGDKKSRTWRASGKLDGSAQLAQTAGTINGLVNAEVANLIVTGADGERFHEPRVRIAAKGDYVHRDGMLRLEQLKLTSAALGVDAAGQVAQTGQQTNLQLDGQTRYDLEKITGLLRPYTGPWVQLVGAGSGPISYRGPLSPAEARAAAAMNWQSANLYGFQIGPGQLKATLSDGVISTEPMDLNVSQGQLHLAPKVRVAPEPIELTMPPGPLAVRVNVTPTMCDLFLKYIAPVMAGVTTAQGAFSIEMEGCRVPLADPAKGELAGQFIIHSVEIGPGPMVRELAALLGRAAPAKLRRESVVRFRMVRGRIYHEGLELIFPDLTIRTHGSVGLDQTLAIMAEMGVPPKWLGNNPLGNALRNTTIRLPIAGTLNKPRLDQREIQRLSQKFIRDATRNVLENEVGRQLERLFGQPR